MFRTVPVKVEDKDRLKDLSKRLGIKEYEVIKKLLDIYEKLELLQHYLGCESIDDLFEEIESMLPKNKRQLLIAETNKYLDKLRNLGVPEQIATKLSEMIYPLILNGGKR